MTKRCAKCGIEKPTSEFRKDRKSKDGLGCWCKDCDRAYKREYYAANRERIRANHRDRYQNDAEYRQKINDYNNAWNREHSNQIHATAKTYRDELQVYIDSLKTNCVKCGEDRKWLIQFHHIIPDNKNFQIQATHSKENLLEESKKCVCMCCNCHTEYHFFFGKKPSNPELSLQNYLSEDFNYEQLVG